MNGKAMQLLSDIVGEIKPAAHPRTDDSLRIGEDDFDNGDGDGVDPQ